MDGVLKDSKPTTTGNLVLGAIGWVGPYSDIDIFNINANSETFDLNSGNGFTSTGSLGTVLTGQTSAADATNYWNQNVIKTI